MSYKHERYWNTWCWENKIPIVQTIIVLQTSKSLTALKTIVRDRWLLTKHKIPIVQMYIMYIIIPQTLKLFSISLIRVNIPSFFHSLPQKKKTKQNFNFTVCNHSLIPSNRRPHCIGKRSLRVDIPSSRPNRDRSL